MESSGISRYNRREIFQSIYCYKDTDILINKQGIREAKALAEYEADVTMLRQYELEKEQLVKGRFSITHLKRIHWYIFQDVYPFAGKLRTENIGKGSTEFYQSEYIYENLTTLLRQLKEERYLKGLNPEKFSSRAAYYMAELNLIHPFREGNGRSIREFIRQLAFACGYIINWSLIKGEPLLEAMIVSVNTNYNPLTKCIFEVIENK